MGPTMLAAIFGQLGSSHINLLLCFQEKLACEKVPPKRWDPLDIRHLFSSFNEWIRWAPQWIPVAYPDSLDACLVMTFAHLIFVLFFLILFYKYISSFKGSVRWAPPVEAAACPIS